MRRDVFTQHLNRVGLPVYHLLLLCSRKPTFDGSGGLSQRCPLMARSHGRRTARIVFAWLATPNYAAPHPLSLPSELHDDSACNSAYPFCSSLLAHVAVGFCRAAKPTRSAREGLSIRGFTNVLSPGIDQLAAELRNRNVSTTVANHVFYPALANEALQDCKSGRVSSIVLVGHSFGASAAIAMPET